MDDRPARRGPRGDHGLDRVVRVRTPGGRLVPSTFDDFCDWYAEAIKARLYDRDPDALATALALLERLLAYLHPVMPHVTEEIWTALPIATSG